MIRIVPATQEMFRKFTGRELERSAYLIAAVDGEKILGVCGMRPEVELGRNIVWMDISDELRKNPRALIHAGRMIMAKIHRSKMPTHVVCDESIAAAQIFLEHWGFRRLYKGVFTCH